jgi:hypothetical protein
MPAIRLVAVASIITLAMTGEPLRAGEAVPVQTIQPLQALSLKAGPQHAVGYFTRREGQCSLVLTFAETPDFDDADGVVDFIATRFEAIIPPGKFTRYTAAEGRSWMFACLTGASAMAVTETGRVVASAGR